MSEREVATFGAGCFWCVEAVFRELAGVEKVTSGYAGGTVPNPTYEQVCAGTTGHAEAIQVVFDPAVIRYEELLTIFWKTHDPTTLNRQGGDVGTQYRSAIFYHSEEQRQAAGKTKAGRGASGYSTGPACGTGRVRGRANLFAEGTLVRRQWLCQGHAAAGRRLPFQ